MEPTLKHIFAMSFFRRIHKYYLNAAYEFFNFQYLRLVFHNDNSAANAHTSLAPIFVYSLHKFTCLFLATFNRLFQMLSIRLPVFCVM